MDQTKKPLRIPPSFSIYAEEHGLFDMFKRLTCDVVINKPEDPLQFAIDWLRKDNDQVPKVAVIGAPSSGKTSVSRALANEIKVVLVDEKELLSDEFSEDVLRAWEFKNKKQLVPDKLWVKLLAERLNKGDCKAHGYILEEFPRNRLQAIGLQGKGILLDHVVVLEAPSMVLIERQSGKRIDPFTDAVYHTTFDWPDDPEVQERLVHDDYALEAGALSKKMDEFARNIDGVLSSYPSTHKKINADQPKADVLTQTLSFVGVDHRSNAPHTPRVVLLGPVGSGKSTLAAKLAKKYKLVDVDCGELVKQHIAGGTRLGVAAKEATDRGVMVENQVVSKMVLARLSQLDASVRGWVLHGFPVTRKQAETLTEAGYRANRVYFLDIPSDSVIERLSYRMLDPVTGDRYHQLYDPPRTHKVRERLVRHPKDKEVNVRQRLNEYNYFCPELLDYYSDFKPYHVNADQDHHTIMEYVESTIVNPLRKDLKHDSV